MQSTRIVARRVSTQSSRLALTPQCLLRRAQSPRPLIQLTATRTARHASHAPHTPSYGKQAIASYSTGRSAADEVAEELQLMYAEAKDEFEIATESTEGHTSYAAEDREAAREFLDILTNRWKKVIDEGGEVAEDLGKRPIGQRIRELTAAVEELNKKDYED